MLFTNGKFEFQAGTKQGINAVKMAETVAEWQV